MSNYRYGQPSPDAFPVKVALDDAYTIRIAGVEAGSPAAQTIDKALATGMRNSQADIAPPDSVYGETVVAPTREFTMGLREVGKVAPGTMYPMPHAVGNVAIRGLQIIASGEPLPDLKGELHNNFSEDEQVAAQRILDQISVQEDDLVEQALMRVDRLTQAREERHE